MKITDIRCYVVEEPASVEPYRWRTGLPVSNDGLAEGELPRVAYVRMDTDAGVTGAYRAAPAEAVASLVKRRFKSLIGQNPLMSELLWHKVWEIDRVEEIHIRHLGIVDMLVWDIKSKQASMPVYQMLGGYHDRVPVYASTVTWDTMDEYERYIKMCVDEGFTAFKLHAWGDAKEDARLSHNLRKWTGPDSVLMFDGSAGWDYVTSLWFGRQLEDAGFVWLEEPMREFDLTSYKKLCDALDIPILAAETSDGCHWNAATWIDMGALDMMRTNPMFKGGMTGALKVAHLAESHGMKAQVHGMGYGQAHICGAIPNNDYYEQLVHNERQIKALKTQEHLPIKEGWLEIPQAPGLGLEPDWARLERDAILIV
ncbi:MAG: enolase C-terminal domain-like protein [Pseudomonadota bacterium]